MPDMRERDTVTPAPPEGQLWRDAYHISFIGASNALAVLNTLEQWREVFGDDHTAVRAIRGHLEYLRGDGLGPEMEDLHVVEVVGRLVQVMDEDIPELPSWFLNPRAHDIKWLLDWNKELGVVAIRYPGGDRHVRWRSDCDICRVLSKGGSTYWPDHDAKAGCGAGPQSGVHCACDRCF